jgi:soluble lytic murein transglycosylase-like protein
MTIDITSLSLLQSALAQGAQKGNQANSAGEPDGVFAGRLDQALGTATTGGQGTPANPQELAEALSLQMLQTTLNLAGESSPETTPVQLFGQQPSTAQTLVKAYADIARSAKADAPPRPTLLEPGELESLSPVSPPTVAATKGTEWLDPIIAKASQRYGVDTGLIKAVIKAESNFNPTAVSSAGARGLMQLMPGTARGLGVSDSFDPEQNVMAGTRFLRDLLNRYNGDLDSALAAYNWGPGNVDRRPDRMPAETRNYLARVKQLYMAYTG